MQAFQGRRLSSTGRVSIGGKQVTGAPEFGVSSELPALSVCRLEAREELLRKLRQHVDDPALAEFTCPICWEPFWQPVRTVCGHAFCEGCLLKSVLAQLGQPQPDVSCPLCRHPLHVDDVSADQALLTKIRLVVTAKEGENSPHRGNTGRIRRGLVRAITPGIAPSSPAAPRPGYRPGTLHETGAARAQPLHCTGRPYTPMTAPTGSQMGSLDLDGAPAGPLLGGWIRVAPLPGARPPTSGSLPRRADRGSSASGTVRPRTVGAMGSDQTTSPGGKSPAFPSGRFTEDSWGFLSEAAEATSSIAVVDWRSSPPSSDNVNVLVLDDVDAEDEVQDEAALRWTTTFSGLDSISSSAATAEDAFPGCASVAGQNVRLPGLPCGSAAIAVIPEAEATELHASSAAAVRDTIVMSATPRLSAARPSDNSHFFTSEMRGGSKSSCTATVQLELPESSRSAVSSRVPNYAEPLRTPRGHALQSLPKASPKAAAKSPRLQGTVRQTPRSDRVVSSSHGSRSSRQPPRTAPASLTSRPAISNRPRGTANIAASSVPQASYEADFAFATRYRIFLDD